MSRMAQWMGSASAPTDFFDAFVRRAESVRDIARMSAEPKGTRPEHAKHALRR
jgi:hypothetical protein